MLGGLHLIAIFKKQTTYWQQSFTVVDVEDE